MSHERMKAKDYLNQIRLMDIALGNYITELEQMRERISIVTGIDYSKDRIQASPETGNRQIEELVDFERMVLDKIKAETDLRHKIIEEIQTLTNPIYVEILSRRYVECHSFERIACNMGYAYNYVCTLHGEALKEFDCKVLQGADV